MVADLRAYPNFVVIEGNDGMGKSTLIQGLKDEFPNHHFTHQPSGGSPFNGQIYRYLETHQTSIDNLSAFSLHLAAQAEHYRTLRLMIEGGSPIIMDRFWWSAIAYNFYADRLRERIHVNTGLDLLCQAARGMLPRLVIRVVGTPFTHPDDPDRFQRIELGYDAAARLSKPHIIQVFINVTGKGPRQVLTEAKSILRSYGHTENGYSAP